MQLIECLDSGFVPSWLTRGRASLLRKDKSKGNVATNYRPITCLEFGTEKCATLVMEKGKIVKSVSIELPDGNVTRHYRKVKVISI